MIIVASGFVICVLVAIGYWWWRRRWTLALDWPAVVGLNEFSSLVATYLKHQGWTVETPPIARHTMTVRKGKEFIKMMCLPSLVQYDSAKIHDLVQLSTGPRQLVCITTSEVPHLARSSAAAGRVLLLHYKKLDMFASSKTGQAAILDAMREQLLEETRATTSMPLLP